MKYIVLNLFVFSLYATSIQSQSNLNQVLRKYRNDQGVVNMNFNGESLKKFIDSTKKLKSIIDEIDIIMFEKKSDISASDKLKISNVINRDKYESIIDIKHKDGKVKVYAIDTGPYLTRLYAQINSPDMNIYLQLSGKIVFEELSQLGLNFNEKASLDILKKLQK